MADPSRSFSFNNHDERSFNNPHDEHTQQAVPFLSDDNMNDPPPPPAHRMQSPGMHPGMQSGMHQNSRYNDMQSQRQYGVPVPQYSQQAYSPAPPAAALPRRPVHQSPPNPAHGYSNNQQFAPQRPSPPPQQYSPPRERRGSFTTPGMDNVGQASVGGGLAGIAMGVAGHNERESGVQAMRDIDSQPRYHQDSYSRPVVTPPERHVSPYEYPSPPQNGQFDHYDNRGYMHGQAQQSSTSIEPLAASAYSPGMATPNLHRERNMQYENQQPYNQFQDVHTAYPYRDDPYINRFSASHTRLNPALQPINPNDIEDDGDDGINYSQGRNRRSFLGMGGRNTPTDHGGMAPAAGAVAGAAVAGGVLSNLGQRNQSAVYDPVPGAAANNIGGSTVGSDNAQEKSEWLNKQSHGNKKLKWIVGIIIVLLIIGGVVGGILGGVVFKKKDSNDTSQNAAEDNKTDLSANSNQIKDLLNNPDLHKVFPAIDYTPMNALYPECIKAPPSQNNVTRDMAVFSQMTNAVRLYGTDCNQTQMVIHAIQQLKLTDMKVWLGVHLDSNQTTNTRQLAQMWDILNEFGADPFKGVIVGNEVLFREDLTITELGTILDTVKTNLTNKRINLPLATADLGTNWTPQLATNVDIVMANIHPFFAGVTAEAATAWTYNFWQDNDIAVTAGMTGKTHIISEVGWPSAGGNNCGASTCASTTAGSVAGVDEMNTFMEGWVCEALRNGTEYFWFEAIDEPWKIRFNEPGKEWEDKWGLMDVNRNLKPGVKIPDCGGQTV